MSAPIVSISTSVDSKPPMTGGDAGSPQPGSSTFQGELREAEHRIGLNAQDDGPLTSSLEDDASATLAPDQSDPEDVSAIQIMGAATLLPLPVPGEVSPQLTGSAQTEVTEPGPSGTVGTCPDCAQAMTESDDSLTPKKSDQTNQTIVADATVALERADSLVRKVDAAVSERADEPAASALPTNDGRDTTRSVESGGRAAQESPDPTSLHSPEQGHATSAPVFGGAVGQVLATTAGRLSSAFGQAGEFSFYEGDDGPIKDVHMKDLSRSAAPEDVQTMDHVATSGSDSSGDDGSQPDQDHPSRSAGAGFDHAGSESRVGTAQDASFATHVRRADVSQLPNLARPIVDVPGRPFETSSPSVRLDLAHVDGEPLQVHVSLVHQTVYARIVTSQTDVQDFLARNQGRLEASLEQHGLEVGQFLVDSGSHHHHRSSQEWGSQTSEVSQAVREIARSESDRTSASQEWPDTRYRLNLVV